MECSKCGKTLEFMGEFGGVFSSAASVRGYGSSSDFVMWRANVCTKCRLVFCGNCIKLGRPTPCPQCGNPTEPAYKGTLKAMGEISKFHEKNYSHEEIREKSYLREVKELESFPHSFTTDAEWKKAKVAEQRRLEDGQTKRFDKKLDKSTNPTQKCSNCKKEFPQGKFKFCSSCGKPLKP